MRSVHEVEDAQLAIKLRPVPEAPLELDVATLQRHVGLEAVQEGIHLAPGQRHAYGHRRELPLAGPGHIETLHLLDEGLAAVRLEQ